MLLLNKEQNMKLSNMWVIAATKKDLPNELLFFRNSTSSFWSNDPSKAASTHNKEKILEAYAIVLGLFDANKFKAIDRATIMPVKLLLSIDSNSINPDELLQIRQNVALKKLSNQDIVDLGLEELAVFHKLKDDLDSEPQGLFELFAEEILF
jgi:hypothetical protein